MTKAEALVEQINALLAINASGAAVPRVPGLAVQLLTEAAAALSRTPGEAVAWMIEYENGCRNFYLCEQLALSAGHKQTPLYAHPAPAAPAGEIEALLSAYDAKTERIPLGHENIGLGASSYGWRKAVTKELRALRATLSPGAIAPGVEEIAKVIWDSKLFRPARGPWLGDKSATEQCCMSAAADVLAAIRSGEKA